MKKRILTMLLALVMIVSMLPLAAYAATENDSCVSWRGHDWSKRDGECARSGCDAECTHSKGFNSSNNCTTCGYNCDHKSGSTSRYDSTGKCKDCGYQCQHKNSYGQSTINNGECSICKMKQHTHTYDPTKGTGVCEEEGCTVTCQHPATGGSSWDTQGKCKTCGVACTHGSWNTQGAEGVCQTCGLHCKHEAGFENNRCKTCNKWCFHRNFGGNNSSTFVEGICSSCHYECPHTNVGDDGICTYCKMTVVTHEHNYNYSEGTGKCTAEEGCTVTCQHPVKDGSSWDAQGKCKTCGVACTHSWNAQGVCNTCKLPCSHKDSNGNSAWDDGECDVCGLDCKHTAGYNQEYKCKTCGTACTHRNGTTYTFDAGVCNKCTYVCDHNDGKTGDNCAKCGLPKHTHEFSSVDGKCQVGNCNVYCSHKFSSTTGKCETCQMLCSHSWKDVRYQEGKEATCTKAGVMVVECNHCHMMSAKDVDALGHAKEVLGVFVANTCTKQGISVFKCTRENCNVLLVDYVDALGHTEEIVPGTPATCTATGLTDGMKCSVCNETLQAQVVTDKLPHAWKTVEAKEATCNEDGYNAHQMCEKCQETEGKVVVPSHGTEHDYVNFKCKYCKSYDPNHEHEGEITSTTPASCTAAGSNAFKCKNCDYEWTEKIKKLKHNYVNEKCTACELINPDHEHRYTQIGYTAPTCTADGKLNQRCDICDRHEESKINKLEHTYAGGLCSRCGAAAEHEHIYILSDVTEATCASTGLKTHTCNLCGKVKTEIISATGNHHYVNYRCTVCNKAEPNKITIDDQIIHVLGDDE